MKSLFFLFAAAICLLSCNSRNHASDIQVIDSNESSMTLNITDQKPEYAAVYHLLFRGIPNSNQTTPLISTSEDAAEKQFPEYFKKLFNENRYKTFVTSSSKIGNGSQRVVVNTKALRLDLEQNSIIRKFGY